jgi:hypothetical protein
MVAARPERRRIGSLVVIVTALVTVAAIAVLVLRRDNSPAPADPVVAADSVSSDPLPLRRLAAQDGGELVLEAIEASGGWDAWRGRTAATLVFEGVFFDEAGALRETRAETHRLTLHPPARIRIEDGSDATVAGFGPDGAWGAARQSDRRWNPAAGPGALSGQALRDLTLNAWWFFGLPFNLGETDAVLQGPAAQASGDSLVRLGVAWPPAPGETAGRVARLGFDPESGHILEILFTAPGDDPADRHLLRISGYREFEGIWRPTRRALFRADSAGVALFPVFEQRLTEVAWDPAMTSGLFEPPPAP